VRSLWPPLATLVVASLAMVAGMVQFTTALVARQPSSRARWTWGLVYVASWIGIVVAIASIPIEEREPSRTAVAVLAVSGWSAINALWLWLWQAVGRSQERRGIDPELPPDADLLARRARSIAALGGIGLGVSLWAIGAPQELGARIAAPSNRAVSAVALVGGLGFAAFMTGAVRLALGVGHPMSHEEVEELERQARYGDRGHVAPGVYRWSRVRHVGPTRGVEGEKTFTLAEIAEAWRTGAWRRDPIWISVFLMMGGAAAMVTAGVTAALAFGDRTLRTVVGVFVAYTIFQIWRARRRRP